MSPIRILALALIIAGVLALAYGGFSFTRDQHTAQIGPFDLTVKKQERVDVPRWLGIGAIFGGTVLLLVRTRRR